MLHVVQVSVWRWLHLENFGPGVNPNMELLDLDTVNLVLLNISELQHRNQFVVDLLESMSRL